MRVRCERVDCHRAHNLQTLQILFRHALVARQKGSVGGRDARAEGRERLGYGRSSATNKTAKAGLINKANRRRYKAITSLLRMQRAWPTTTECSGQSDRRLIGCFVANSSQPRRHGRLRLRCCIQVWRDWVKVEKGGKQLVLTHARHLPSRKNKTAEMRKGSLSLDVERSDNQVNRKQKESGYKTKGTRDGLPSLTPDAN